MPAKPGRKMDEWNTTVGCMAYYMNVVLREAARPLTTNEIMQEVRRRGYPETGAPEEHLRRLAGKIAKRPTAFIPQIDNRWAPIDRSAAADKVSSADSANASTKPTATAPEDVAQILEDKNHSPTTKLSFVEARLGQGKFRETVLASWGNKCAVTGSTTTAAIRASHIKPWCESREM